MLGGGGVTVRWPGGCRGGRPGGQASLVAGRPGNGFMAMAAPSWGPPGPGPVPGQQIPVRLSIAARAVSSSSYTSHM